MTITYTNYLGDTYYLHSRVTKKGNTSYHFSKKKEDAVTLEQIPTGYEIYEEPGGKVYLRKTSKKLIYNEEIQVIEDGMKKYCPIKDYKLDIKKDIVYIYTVSDSIDATFDSITEIIPFVNRQSVDKYKDYETVMRFCLIDKKSRTFEVERFCFLGGIDDWMGLDESEDLEELVKNYVQHIGQQSFYELF